MIEVRATVNAPEHTIDEVLRLMQLESLEVNLFRGVSRDIGTSRVYGGQVLAQAVLAAQSTVQDRLIHSLHAYFLRAGDPDAPIVYQVDHSRDGRSFTSRRVVAIQHGRPIFTLAASFQLQQDCFEHQFEMPDVPDPEDVRPPRPIDPEQLTRVPQKLQQWVGRFGPFEFRPLQEHNPVRPEPRPPYRKVWFRLCGEVPGEQALHRALLAYVSDFYLIGTATLPHGVSQRDPHLVMASLDHAMWFHRSVTMTDWLLYDCDSPSSSGSRGLARGLIYDRAGRLVASTAQEGMIRWRED